MTTYQEIAKSALIKWWGLSEEVAQEKAETETFKMLEEQVGANNSIIASIQSITGQLELSNEESLALKNAIFKGPADAEIFSVVGTKVISVENKEQFILDIASNVHDRWIYDNSTTKIFDKKVNRKQLYQYSPLELIGYNEVKNDLVFIEPILSSVGIEVDYEKLEKKYHENVAEYFVNNNIDSKETLNELVKTNSMLGETYLAMPVVLSEKLTGKEQEVTEQIINNWKNNDQKSLRIFEVAKMNDTMMSQEDNTKEIGNSK